jgi:hypothetical protein
MKSMGGWRCGLRLGRAGKKAGGAVEAVATGSWKQLPARAALASGVSRPHALMVQALILCLLAVSEPPSECIPLENALKPRLADLLTSAHVFVCDSASGLDPGLQHTGWGLIETDGYRLRFVAEGVVSTSARDALGDRLLILHQGLAETFANFQPDEAAVENTYCRAQP